MKKPFGGETPFKKTGGDVQMGSHSGEKKQEA